jgi:hypothetical protein
VDHHWQVEAFRHRLRACECCEIAVSAAPGLLHSRFDADDRVAMTGNGRTCQGHIGDFATLRAASMKRSAQACGKVSMMIMRPPQQGHGRGKHARFIGRRGHIL